MRNNGTGSSALEFAILEDVSLEMTSKDVAGLDDAKELIPAKTRINITFLGNEDFEMRLTAAKAVKELGFTPIPHISARRLQSESQLHDFLARLREVGASERVFVVGGDPAKPEGPFEHSLGVIRSGILPQYGVQEVSIAGYPEGHPDISSELLWEHLEAKCVSIAGQGMTPVILTQFAFDTDPVIAWIQEVRRRGITAQIRIGTPGPAGVKRLLTFARRFGIGANAMIVKKYGFSLANLMGTAGPARFITDLATLVEGNPASGDVKLHFYTFGGLSATAGWVKNFRARNDR